MPYGNNRGADQLLHPPSLISAFAAHWLDNMMPVDGMHEIWRLKLASVAVQAGLSLNLVTTPKDRFLYDVAQ